MQHYLSDDRAINTKTKEILRRTRLQGNRGIVPVTVLAEAYAKMAMKMGSAEAERRFNEIVQSGLEIVELDVSISKKAATIRHKYHEKIPWGDCYVAATCSELACEYVITEDSEFKSIKEIKCRKIEEFRM